MDDIDRRHTIEKAHALLTEALSKIGGCGSITCAVFIEPEAAEDLPCRCLSDTGKMSRVVGAYNGFRTYVTSTIDGMSLTMGSDDAIKNYRERQAAH